LKFDAGSGMLPTMRMLLDIVSLRRLIFKVAVLALLTGASGVIETGARRLVFGQRSDSLTPIQRDIENQRRRLSSGDIEERRDALMRLGNLKRPDASRVAAAGLRDVAPIVRVAATHAIVYLPQVEAPPLLIPLLQDKIEFVRREAAYALGQTRSRVATTPLVNALLNDKEASVRGAAAVALGEIRDESAVQSLVRVLAGNAGKKKAQNKENVFVRRAAARSLGQIRSRDGVAILIETLANDVNDSDVRREAASALGVIGDSSAAPALQVAIASSDPYLSEAAREALRLIKLGRK
jgi:HEAT repeat protein